MPSVNKVTCDCDMLCIASGHGIETIKKFFRSHPFMTGIVMGYAMKDEGNDQKVIEAICEVAKENYGNPKSWGRR